MIAGMAPTDETLSENWRAAERQYDDETIEMSTLSRLFEESTSRNHDRAAQLYKGGVYDRSLVSAGVVDGAPPERYSSLIYDEMQTIVHNLAAGFRDVGIEPGDRVGIFASTRMEWAQVDFALHVAGGIITTVYTESSPRQVQFLLDDPGASAVIVENEVLLERVLAVEDDLDLSTIIVIDDISGYGDREDIITLGELHRRGEGIPWKLKIESWLNARDVDDLASIIYTSGTTGKPKGVKLTHEQFRANINQCRKRLGPRSDKPPEMPVLSEASTILSFLPLAHVFERTVGHYLMFASGVTVAYAESADTVGNDLALVQPEAATSVPRVFERIYDSMREQARESAVKEHIFNWAMSVAHDHTLTDDSSLVHRMKYKLADRLVFNSVKDQLGGNTDFFISGGGSLSKDLSQLFAGMGLPVIEGYGLTETAPVVSVNPLEDNRPGTLGLPLSGVEVTLDDSQLNQAQKTRAAGEIGELLVRGKNVSPGYWKNPEATEATFTESGWVHTGDIVEQTEDGHLVFHDRLKRIIVLSTGKNVSPAPIENAFSTSDRVEQVLVIGTDEKFISALIVPNFAAIDRWAEREHLYLPDDRETICQNDRVRQWILEEVNRVNNQFEPEEQIKVFELVPDEWTPENDMLTSSLKKKRRNILDRYAGLVDQIYVDRDQGATVES
jgi:long-chain acyl-CoA synthetase